MHTCKVDAQSNALSLPTIHQTGRLGSPQEGRGLKGQRLARASQESQRKLGRVGSIIDVVNVSPSRTEAWCCAGRVSSEAAVYKSQSICRRSDDELRGSVLEGAFPIASSFICSFALPSSLAINLALAIHQPQKAAVRCFVSLRHEAKEDVGS